MWPFTWKQKENTGIRANSIVFEDGLAVIDVCGQTCPGYLLAINKAVDALPQGTSARLLITYPPCGDDVENWCREKSIEFVSMEQHCDKWIIDIRK